MYFILYSNYKSIKTIPRPQEFYPGCPPPPSSEIPGSATALYLNNSL